jgi:hypothetical protein
MRAAPTAYRVAEKAGDPSKTASVARVLSAGYKGPGTAPETEARLAAGDPKVKSAAVGFANAVATEKKGAPDKSKDCRKVASEVRGRAKQLAAKFNQAALRGQSSVRGCSSPHRGHFIHLTSTGCRRCRRCRARIFARAPERDPPPPSPCIAAPTAAEPTWCSRAAPSRTCPQCAHHWPFWAPSPLHAPRCGCYGYCTPSTQPQQPSARYWAGDVAGELRDREASDCRGQ